VGSYPWNPREKNITVGSSNLEIVKNRYTSGEVKQKMMTTKDIKELLKKPKPITIKKIKSIVRESLGMMGLALNYRRYIK